VQSQARQEGVGEEAQGEMMMQSAPRAALEVIEAEFFLQLLVALLDRPVLVRQADQLGEWGVRRQIGQVRLEGAIAELFQELWGSENLIGSRIR
jgi:hypothetical protein